MNKLLITIFLLSFTVLNAQCYLESSGKIQDYSLYNESGSEVIDFAFKGIAGFYSDMLDSNIKYGFYDDYSGPNAFAIKSYNSDYFAETYLGINLLKSFDEDHVLKIYLIMSHEFAHIFQFEQGLNHNKTVWSELEADYIAGSIYAYYYTAAHGYVESDEDIKRFSSIIDRAGNLFYSLGDNNFTDPEHHGTPEQRRESFENGFGQEIRNQLNRKNRGLPRYFSKSKLFEDAKYYSSIIKSVYKDN